jgi:hypothetical protein
MGASKQQVCRDKDPKKAATSRRETSECRVIDSKESGNSFRITMQCPQGTAVLEQTYNAARTEYKGSMKMNTKDGEMTMTMAGRRIGACDAQKARDETSAKVAAMKEQGKKAQAEAAVVMARSRDEQIKQCSAALDTMSYRGFSLWGQCDKNKASCDQMMQDAEMKKAGIACQANVAEYCKRFQTPAGFYKAKGDEQGAQACKVSVATLKPQLCQRALKEESLPYLGRYCQVEGKPLAQQHCIGRSYTSKTKDKYSEFCMEYLAAHGLEGSSKPPATQAEKAKESVNQGLNKLRGLFSK